jgi:hypothetical protein
MSQPFTRSDILSEIDRLQRHTVRFNARCEDAWLSFTEIQKRIIGRIMVRKRCPLFMLETTSAFVMAMVNQGLITREYCSSVKTYVLLPTLKLREIWDHGTYKEYGPIQYRGRK